MPCRTLVNKDGKPIGFACSRSTPTKRCHKCGRPGGKLCDFKLTGAKVGKTCDMSLCGACATHVEPDLDYCPTHAQMMGMEPK